MVLKKADKENTSDRTVEKDNNPRRKAIMGARHKSKTINTKENQDTEN